MKKKNRQFNYKNNNMVMISTYSNDNMLSRNRLKKIFINLINYVFLFAIIKNIKNLKLSYKKINNKTLR